MTCEHLRALEETILDAGIRETFRGAAWSSNCREWVCFDCWFDLAAIRRRHQLPLCVTDHEHRGTHDGSERGLVCQECHDALMGGYEQLPGQTIFAG
jgi:hypothetical protein